MRLPCAHFLQPPITTRHDLSLSYFLDGSFAPAKKGGDKVGLTKKGKGTKWMLVVDGNGFPLGFHPASASTAEVKLAEQTLHAINVGRPRGRPKQRPEKLVADRGYDTYASVNPGNSERELVHKTREIFPRHEAWDIVMFREGGLLFTKE